MSNPELGRGRPVYVVLEGELDLAASPDVAWTHILNIRAWQNFRQVEHVSGVPGGEGELVLLHKDEPGSGKTPYHARTVLLQKGRRVVWKVFRDVIAEGDSTFGIVDFSIAPASGGSVFRYDLFYEFATPELSDEEWGRRRDLYVGNVTRMIAAVMPKLQRLVAGGE